MLGSALGLLLGVLACTSERAAAPRQVQGDLEFSLQEATYWGDAPANNRGVAIDSAGNVVMVGGSDSRTWPSSLPRLGAGGFTDASVAKFDRAGKPLWSVTLGGPGEDYAYVVDITANDEIVVGGRAGPGFPTTTGAFDTTFNGGVGSGPHGPTDGFVAKLAPDGRLLFATYIGGSKDDNVRAIEILRSGMIAVGGGNTRSPDLPTHAGVLPGPVLKPSLGGKKDAWVAVLHPDGSGLDFLTYFGPDNDDSRRGDETIRALAEDQLGNLWIGGTTSGDDMQPTPDAFQPDRRDSAGSASAFIAKLSHDGRRLVYFSWLGGNGFDEIETEGTADAQGNFYVAGSTVSKDFPTTPGAAQRTLRGGGGSFNGDGFVARINHDGSLGFATLHGGSAHSPEALFGPAVDAQGNVYVTGRMASTDVTTTVGAFQPRHAGPPGVHDAVLAVFGAKGQLRYSTYFGGSREDVGRHVAVGPKGRAVVIIGETRSSDLPLEKPLETRPSGAFLALFRHAR